MLKKIRLRFSNLAGLKKKYNMQLSPYEKAVFDKAKKKLFQPTIETLNKIARGGVGQIELIYKPLKTDAKTSTFPLELLDSRDKGLPFKITIDNYLDTGGVLHKESYGLDKELRIIKDGTAYYTEKDAVVNFKTQFPAKPQILEGTLVNFKTFDSMQNALYARMVVHTFDTQIIYPTDILEYGDNHMKFDDAAWDRQSSSIGLPMITTRGMFTRLSISGREFDFYGIEAMNSIIIDSCAPILPDEFKKIGYAIRLGFAFLSGKLYRDETTLIMSNCEDFGTVEHYEYLLEPRSVITSNQLINPTFFFQTFSSRPVEEQEQLKSFHTLFSATVFSRLCETLIESPEITRTVELLITGSEIVDPIQKGALYAVAVETITEHIRDKHETAFKPIQDNAIWKDFLKAQQELIGSFSERVGTEGTRILLNKANGLNSPTNKDKLLKPFELYGIHLTQEETEVLDHRNKYLHGGAPTDSTWIAEQNMHALKLHNLVGLLVLRYCGYQGHYINLAAWHILHLKETNERIEHMDISKLEDIKNRLEAGKIKYEEIAEATEYFSNYRKYLASILEIQNLIKILK
jgi:hypothetical protein